MFQKILIANRGESAIRIWRTCREMGIATVGVYEQGDTGSLHARLCDEVYPLPPQAGYADGAALLDVARQSGADALHPGVGFLARRGEFIRACEEQGLAFIGPDSRLAGELENRWEVLARVKAAGFAAPEISTACYRLAEMHAFQAEINRLGFPCLVKSCTGADPLGWMVRRADDWPAVRDRLEKRGLQMGDALQYYAERALQPVHRMRVQIMASRQGQIISLGERDASIQLGAYRVFDEAPSPELKPEEARRLAKQAADIARLLNFFNQGVFEFLASAGGVFHFLEVKPTIQVGHAVTEALYGVDLVAEQIKIAAGQELSLTQEDIQASGWAMQCRINAVDPSQNFLASPGRITNLRLPGGAGIRVSTHLSCGSEVSGSYAPLLAMITAWGKNRAECLARMQRALSEAHVEGIPTDIAVHRAILAHPRFQKGRYSTEFLAELFAKDGGIFHDREGGRRTADLAAAAAIAYLQRNGSGVVETPPEDWSDGWRREGSARGGSARGGRGGTGSGRSFGQ